MEDKNNNKKENIQNGIPSPFMNNVYAVKVGKIIVRSLTDAELKEISKKMNMGTVVVIGLPDKLHLNIPSNGIFQFNSIGVNEKMIIPLLEFITEVMKHGYGKSR